MTAARNRSAVGCRAPRACVYPLVARYRRIDEHRPCVDAALQVVQILESLAVEVLSGLLAADAVVALEDDGGLAIAKEQRIVIRPVQQTRPGDGGDGALLRGADVDQLDRGPAIEEC